MSRNDKTLFGVICVVLILFILAILASDSEASCHTHKCWHKVHIHHVEGFVQKKINKLTPYRCWTVTGTFRSAKPCWVITQESAMVRTGPWTALNTWTSGAPCWRRACGPYQFLGWNVPWPVLVQNKLERLKRMLAHHRQASRMSLSNW